MRDANPKPLPAVLQVVLVTSTGLFKIHDPLTLERPQFPQGWATDRLTYTQVHNILTGANYTPDQTGRLWDLRLDVSADRAPRGFTPAHSEELIENLETLLDALQTTPLEDLGAREILVPATRAIEDLGLLLRDVRERS